MEKVLKIYELVNDVVTPFPNSTLQAELYSFQYDCKRMGNAPTIMGTIMYPLCLDNLWNDKVFVQFNDEKYFIDLTPSSSYSNTDTRYKHEVTFVSERRILEDVYFKDLDKYTDEDDNEVDIDVDTDFHFFGDLNLVKDKLNNFLSYANIPYTCFVDKDLPLESKDVHISGMKINEFLQYLYNDVYEIPYYFKGKEIHFGYYETTFPETLEYGVENSLLSINKENKNEQPITRITGVGSGENIPYYYPNLNPSGEHKLYSDPTYIKENVTNINYLKLDQHVNLRQGEYVTFYKGQENTILNDMFRYINIGLYGHVDNKQLFSEDYSYNKKEYTINYGKWKGKNFNTSDGNSYSKVTYHILMPEENARYQSTQITIKCSANLTYTGTNVVSFQNHYPIIQNVESTEVSLSQENVTQSDDEFEIKFTVPKNKNYIAFSLIFYHHVDITYMNTDFDWAFNYQHDIEFSDNNYQLSFTTNEGTFDEKSTINSSLSVIPNQTITSITNIKYSITKYYQQYTNITIQKKLSLDYLLGDQNQISDTKLISPNSYTTNINKDNYHEIKNTDDILEIRIKEDGIYTITFNYDSILIPEYDRTSRSDYIKLEIADDVLPVDRSSRPYDYFYFQKNDKEIEYDIDVIRLQYRTLRFDGTTFTILPTTNWIAPKSTLMPYIYRETLGKDIWYEAEKDKYFDENGVARVFKNLYSDRKKEYISEPYQDIKPTIVGVTNASNERIDMFADIAFDDDDNNIDWVTNEDGTKQELKHSFFYVKLRKTDGDDGFNLFEQSIENGEMTINMTNGHCGTCQFKIMVDEETGKNTVQVDENGNLVRDDEGNVITYGTPQDRQQDTSQYEVWIALRKEESTYGIIMPDKQANLIPTTNDTFVITNIMLPRQYITRAEKRLEEALIKKMVDNNIDKFNFSISFSRIYWQENLNLLQNFNENNKIYVKYNGIKTTLSISSYSYKMDSQTSLPQINVELEDSYTTKKKKKEGYLIPSTPSIKIDLQNELLVRSSNIEKKFDKEIKKIDVNNKIVQKTGDSRNMIMSQYAVTKAIEDNKTKVSSYLGNSDTETISQRTITNQIYNIHDMIREIDTSKMQYVTYEELISLIKNDSLIAGMKYRITDYETIIDILYHAAESGVIITSANHPFDLIVTATSSNTLDCNAQAVLRAGDTYFINSELHKWKIKYNVDIYGSQNKGIIYYMKDQNGNEASYDFKNIQFTFTEDYPYQIPSELQYNTPYYTFTLLTKGVNKYNTQDVLDTENFFVGDGSIAKSIYLYRAADDRSIHWGSEKSNIIKIEDYKSAQSKINTIFISIYDNSKGFSEWAQPSFNTAVESRNTFITTCIKSTIKAQGIYKGLQDNIVQKNSQGDTKIFNLADLIV